MTLRHRPFLTSPSRRISGATFWRAFLLATLLLGPAQAALAQDEYYAISPASLQNRDPVLEDSYFQTDFGYFTVDGAGGGCLYAPVHLPDGVTILGLVMHYYDVGPGTLAAGIHRKSLHSADNSENLGYVESSGSAGGIRVAVDLSIVNGTVDLDNYAYFAIVCLPSVQAELHGIYLSFTR